MWTDAFLDHSGLHGKTLTPAARTAIAAVRALCLRAPTQEAPQVTIDDVVNALLRVTPFRDGHETGSTGLVRRADVEQVMRALFDRSGK